MGQLLAYMEQLFANRKSDWKTIYEHIISMPESVEAKRLIKAARFEERPAVGGRGGGKPVWYPCGSAGGDRAAQR